MNHTMWFPDDPEGDVFSKAQRVARIKGETVSSVVIATLVSYVEENRHLTEAVDRAEKKKRERTGVSK